jgi:ABC-type branched-subunit amino acid transport system substrate-binding protein
MKRRLTVLTAALALLSLLLAACGAPSTSTQPSAGGASTSKTAIIGFTASLTGKSNVESTRQKNGLQLWMDQVKANGGLALADGNKVTFDARSYDDESNNERVQELYARLINEDKADFLISPYGSGPADAAAVLAEQYGKIMITAGAASDSTYKKGYTLVYQTYTPASRYLTGALDTLAKLDPNAKKVAIVHENDKFSTDVVKALQTYAEGKGYQIVVFEGYDTNTTDFGPIINKVQQAQPDAILGGGHFQDGNTFAKQLAEKRIDARFLALLVAPPEPKFAELGDSALGVVGPSQWEPLAAFTAEAAKTAGLEWYGPAGAEFVSAYKAAYGGEEPSYHAAGGYVAGLILQRAIEQAGSLDTKAVKEALDKLDMLTFFGHIKFDTGEAHGLQIGHDMVYIQWQKDAGGKLAKQVIWPAEGATSKALYPIR